MKRKVRMDVLSALLQDYFKKKTAKSKTEFAILVKTSPSSLNRWMKMLGSPKEETVVRIARELWVSPDDLFEEKQSD